MSDDLVQRLRALSRHEHSDLSIGDEAADAIERKDTEIERLRASLESSREVNAKLCQRRDEMDAEIAELRARAERAERRIADAESPWWWSMSDLIRKLDRLLTGDNPCAYHKMTPDEWAELRAMLVVEEDASHFRVDAAIGGG